MRRVSLACLVLVATVAAPISATGPPGAGQVPAFLEVQRVLDRLTRPGPVRAAADSPLTLDAALDEAMARNRRLIALRREFDMLRNRPIQAGFLAPPTFEAQVWQWPVDTLNPAETDMYMFMVDQQLPGSGKRALRSAVLDTEVELAAAAIAIEARNIVGRVQRAYASVFVIRREIEIHHSNVELLRQFADISEAKYTTGSFTQQDVLKAVVELSKIQDHLIVLEEREKIAAAELNTLLDRPVDGPIARLIEPAEQAILPALHELQRLAVEQQPDLHAAALGVSRAEAELEVVRSEYRPDFSVMGGYMLMPGRRDAWMAKVGITWPTALWTRGRLEAKKAEATASVAAARARQDAAASAIREAVYSAFIRTQSAARRAELLRTTIVPQSEQTLEVSRVGYQADQVDFFALIDNQRILLDAQVAYYRALSDLERARADLERAVGTQIKGPVGASASVSVWDGMGVSP